ncbi:MAG: vitamin K epoxide reductase family protein [Candidatus Paceibacterota bacterium]
MEKLPSALAKQRLWILILAWIGILLAAYLFYEYAVQDTFGVCNINATINCEPVTKGALALFYGIPVAIIGGIGYILIFLTAWFKKFKWSFGFASFGMLFCLRLTFLEFFVEKVICPVCIACQIIMLIILILTYQSAFSSKAKLLEKSAPQE